MHSFSIFIPTYNAEKWLPRCLDSIAKQVYPRDKVEVLVVDGGSTDRTLHIAQNYGARIFHHRKQSAHYSFDIFGKHATGDLAVMFAADNEMSGSYWLKCANDWFIFASDLGAVWGPQVSGVDDPLINDYYACIQNDPMSWFTNNNLQFYLDGATYGRTFKVYPERPLVWGANGLVLRMKWVRDYFCASEFVGDNDIFQQMIEAGHDKVAYLSNFNTVHHHVESVGEWVRKLCRNFHGHFLQHHTTRKMGWARGAGFNRKLALWSLYAAIPIPAAVHALYLMCRDRNLAWLYHPLLATLQFWVYTWLCIGTRAGRSFLLRKG